jgi:hypothetical protein
MNRVLLVRCTPNSRYIKQSAVGIVHECLVTVQARGRLIDLVVVHPGDIPANVPMHVSDYVQANDIEVSSLGLMFNGAGGIKVDIWWIVIITANPYRDNQLQYRRNF